MLPRPRVLGVEFRECEEVLRSGAHHPAELEDLVAGASDEHDGEHGTRDRHMAMAPPDGVGPHVQVRETGRYMAMAPPERMEWVPTSRCEKRRTSGPIRLAPACNWPARKVELIHRRWLFAMRVLTRESVSQPG